MVDFVSFRWLIYYPQYVMWYPYTQICDYLAVCEHAYSLAQNLDPNSEGRGVLQFKTGLMSVIKVLFTMKVASHFAINAIYFQGEKVHWFNMHHSISFVTC